MVRRAASLWLLFPGGIGIGLAQGASPPSAPSGPDSLAAPHGQVIFSRSTADSPDTAHSPASSEAAPPALAASITDATRTSVAFTGYDFTIHLQPETASLQVELRAALRNTGSAPLAALPLQLSSSLHFEHIRSGRERLRQGDGCFDESAGVVSIASEAVGRER